MSRRKVVAEHILYGYMSRRGGGGVVAEKVWWSAVKRLGSFVGGV